MKEKRKRIIKKVDYNKSTIIKKKLKFEKDFTKPFYELSKENKNTVNLTKINEEMRTSPPKKTSLRLELETYVYAWNNVLKDAVKTMNMIVLLRNAHPTYRSAFASQAFEIGLISDQERKEFVIPSLREYSQTNWRL